MEAVINVRGNKINIEHTLFMATKEVFDAWKRGELYFDEDEAEFVTSAEAVERAADIYGDDGFKNKSINTAADFNETLRAIEIYTHEDYKKIGVYFETKCETEKHKECVVAFGYYRGNV